jgi:predicted RNA binding protein YcfA (HicA-like mRNA interferase family)
MSISGRELMRLLEQDGWTRGGRRTHGVFYSKQFPGESRPRSTVVPDKATPLPPSTLGAILSVKQTGIGASGLQALIQQP